MEPRDRTRREDPWSGRSNRAPTAASILPAATSCSDVEHERASCSLTQPPHHLHGHDSRLAVFPTAAPSPQPAASVPAESSTEELYARSCSHSATSTAVASILASPSLLCGDVELRARSYSASTTATAPPCPRPATFRPLHPLSPLNPPSSATFIPKPRSFSTFQPPSQSHSPPTGPRSFHAPSASPTPAFNGSSVGGSHYRPPPPTYVAPAATNATVNNNRPPPPSAPRALRQYMLSNRPTAAAAPPGVSSASSHSQSYSQGGSQYIPRGPSADRDRDRDRTLDWENRHYRAPRRGGGGQGWSR